jgi:hypothetical protein
MRPILLLLAGVAVLPAGCQALQLANLTLKQSRTLTDIQYQEVLDNLAMQVEQPDALPWFNQTGAGKTTIQNVGTATGGVSWDYLNGAKPGTFLNHADKKNVGLTATEQIVGEWDTTPVINPDKLFLMRLLYMRALGRCADPVSEERLRQFFKGDPQRLEAVQPGWYSVGTDKDCPKDARYKGHFGHTCVWVTDSGLGGLTSLTLAILDVATISTNIVFLTPAQVLASATKAQEERVKTMTDLYEHFPEPDSEADILIQERFHRQLLVATLKLEQLYSTRSEKEKEALYRQAIAKIFENVKPESAAQTLSKGSMKALQKMPMNRQDTFLKELNNSLDTEARQALDPTSVNAAINPPPAPIGVGPILRPREQPSFFPYGPNIVPIP